MKKSNKYAQQGDIIWRKAKKLPTNAKLLDTRVVAEGEATGHKHEITWGDAGLYEADGVLYAHNPTETVSFQDHPEHGTIILEKGTFKENGKREYDPFEQEARKVRD